MSVNDMQFQDIAAILNDINKAVTGNEQSIAPKNTKEFVSVATTLVQGGLDPLRYGVTQVLSDTIFSIRPYYRKFGDLQTTRQRFGMITRKLVPIDRDVEKDIRYELENGQSIDHYKINMLKVLMTHFYGAAVYKRRDTTTTDQLLNAFRNETELAEFFAMKESNIRDMIEQDHESTARMTVANFIGGKVASDNGVVHLLQEYAAHTGVTLTDVTVYHPDNFKPFCDWLFTKVDTIAGKMSERSGLYQVQVENKPVNHHTQGLDLNIYLYRPLKTEIEKRVLSNTYHDNYLKFAKNEAVNFWQNISDGEEMKISVQPSYMGTNGNIIESDTTISADKVVGVMFDRDAMGYTMFNTKAINTPVNADGDYYNTVYHYTDRYWNDFTEKGVVLLLD